MALHLPTLLLLMLLTSSVLGLSVLFVESRTRLHAGLSAWGLGLLANALSYLAFALRYQGSLEWSILVNNLLSALTLAFHIIAVQRYQRGRAWTVPEPTIWATVVFAMLLAAFWIHDHQERNVVSALLLSGLCGVLALQAWGPGVKGHRVAGRWLVVLGATTLGLALLGRSAYLWHHGLWDGTQGVPEDVQALTYLVVLFALLTNTIGFVLMQMEHAVDVQRDLATHDPLTGAANRRELMAVLGRSLALAQRGGRPLALLMADIDHFKQVNDQYGHQVGDAVLVEVARRIQARLRRQDLLARFGGEEFVVLLPDTDTDGALKLAESVRLAIASAPVVCGGQPIALSISIGVHARVVKDMADDKLAERMIAACDRAMYSAKGSGRNRVVAGD
jgi:diguanylate cyclase (GGDEF)-like protein